MAFTYDLTTDRGKCRLKLADTVSASSIFTDAEIDYFLSEGGSISAGAILGLQVLIVDAARRERFFKLKDLSLDTKGQVAALKTAIEVLTEQQGGLPAVSVTFPALLPMDTDYDESNP